MDAENLMKRSNCIMGSVGCSTDLHPQFHTNHWLSPLSRYPIRIPTLPTASPTILTPLTPVCGVLGWVQPLRLEARVYLEANRKPFGGCAPCGEGQLRRARWGGVEARRDLDPEIWPFLRNLGLWGRTGSYGGDLCCLAALAVPAFDIILSPGKRWSRCCILVLWSRPLCWLCPEQAWWHISGLQQVPQVLMLMMEVVSPFDDIWGFYPDIPIFSPNCFHYWWLFTLWCFRPDSAAKYWKVA